MGGTSDLRSHARLNAAVRTRHKNAPTTKKHRFEPFSHRVARIKIDPVRQLRGLALDNADSIPTTSYFRTSLESWLDLNLSERFTVFTKEVEPLSNSLPQILHHQDQIIDLLLSSVQDGTPTSLEPLLDLVAQLAHDLGARFETHFPKTVKVISHLASINTDIQVIEWSFNCLAWLFKYLSKLLVPDLRPLYDLISPTLGKERQKGFVMRFAAEAFSFLLRRASLLYPKDTGPLETILSHILNDVCEFENGQEQGSYKSTVIALFAEAITGSDGGFSSKGDVILRQLMTISFGMIQRDQRKSDTTSEILRGIMSSVLYRGNSQSCQAVLNEIMIQTTNFSPTNGPLVLSGIMTLLLHPVCIKSGRMVDQWNTVFDVIATAISHLGCSETLSTAAPHVFTALAVAHQAAPVDSAIHAVKLFSFAEKTSPDTWNEHFLGFCQLYAELGGERFRTFLLPEFQRFATVNWEKHVELLCVLLPRFVENGILLRSTFRISSAWSSEIESALNVASNYYVDDRNLWYLNGIIDMISIAKLDNGTEDRIASSLIKMLKAVTAEASSSCASSQTFLFGRCFGFLADCASIRSKMLDIWPLVCLASKDMWNKPIYWKSTLQFIERRHEDLQLVDENADVLLDSMITCLASPSHELRLLALKIAAIIKKTQHGTVPESLDIAIAVEETTPNIQTMRFISMQVRKLAKAYLAEANDTWTGKAVPAYCFGLLRVHFAAVWEDAYSALKVICTVEGGERVVCDRALQWLKHECSEDDSEADYTHVPETVVSSGVKNHDIHRILGLRGQLLVSTESPIYRLKRSFEQAHVRIPSVTRLDRSQAIRILKEIPQLAEKRSRALVPVLLRWVAHDDDVYLDGGPTATARNDKKWTRADQKELLSLFALFVNPKSLYKSDEVHSALLTLLGHGDVEIQRSAFQAILTWKNKTIKLYQEELLKILDDAKFREQISVFLAVGEDGDSLQPEHSSEVMPIVLRLLYGRVIKRGSGDQSSNRKAVFGLISRLGRTEAHEFLNIILGPFSMLPSLTNSAGIDNHVLETEFLTQRKQLGLLIMVNDMLDCQGLTAAPFAPRLVEPVIHCLVRTTLDDHSIEQNGSETQAASSLSRSIRTTSLQCLQHLFSILQEFNWYPYVHLISQKIVIPRLKSLPSEFTQGVSWLLRLFATWADSTDFHPFLTNHHTELLHKLAECIGVVKCKEEVKRFIIQRVFFPMFENPDNSEQPAEVRSELKRVGPYLLSRLEKALHQDVSIQLLENAVQLIVRVADVVTATSPELIRTATYLLRQPSRRVKPDCKLQLLQILEKIIPDADMDDELFTDIFSVVCSSCALNVPPPVRLLLSNILLQLADKDNSLLRIALIIQDMNAFSGTKLDEPDFVRRTKAFYTINEELYLTFTGVQWQLALSNALFYIKDNTDIAMRVSSAHCIKRFIEATSLRSGNERNEFLTILQNTVMNNIELGIREQPELVRVEYISILAQLVQFLPDWTLTKDLVALTWNDDESSFFNNILHIQQHRRLRALKRLGEESKRGTISSRTIAHLLVPLLEHFVFSSSDGTISAEASRIIGSLSEWMDFPQYRALFQRYISYIHLKRDQQEIVLKLLDWTATAFSEAGRSRALGNATTVLSKSLPSDEKLPRIIVNDFLPPFYKYLQDRDESFVSLRVPAAIIAAKVIHLLPRQEFRLRFPPLLTDTCNILRSKDQNSRDLTRNALAAICSLVGPSAIGFVVGELRRVLQKGFHLHVLGYTVHSILDTTITAFKPGDLDYCLNDIVGVVMDDIFGSAGQEKDVSDYVKDNSSRREVKSKKSFDSMQLLASLASLPRLIDLVKPIELLLAEKLNHKMLHDVDELLRRIELGIAQNGSIVDRDILVFCYQIIKDTYIMPPVYGVPSSSLQKRQDVPLPSRKRVDSSHAISRQERTGKIVKFAFEVARSVLRKHRGLKTPANIAGFLPILGDAFLQDHEEIKIAAIRLLTSLISVPLDRLDEDAPAYIDEAVRIVEDSQTTGDELSQAALKLLAAILRERKSVSVPEHAIAKLLQRIKPDLQVISQQGVAFNLIRAIIARKIIMPEIYALIDGNDGIAAISLRDHDRTTRDSARGVYFQFIMEYPQSKKRFSKQIDFLVSNLEYEHAEGRQSAMEALNLLLNKFQEALLQKVVRDCFWPVVSIMVNDDSSDCRVMASGLIKTVFTRADEEWMRGFRSLLRKLLDKDSRKIQRRTGLQCCTMYLEAFGSQSEDIPFVLNILEETLGQRDASVEDSWQLIYYALHTLLTLCKCLPNVGMDGRLQNLWERVWQQLSFPHSWVKHEAAKLTGLLIAEIATSGVSTSAVPLIERRGLKLNEETLCDLCSRHLGILRDGVTDDLASQVVRNLAFVGRCFAESGIPWRPSGTKEKPDTVTIDNQMDLDDDEESLDDEEDQVDLETTVEQTAVHYLYSQLSRTLRKESQKLDDGNGITSRRTSSLVPRSAALQLMAGLSTTLPLSAVQPSLHVIMLPLLHLTDSSVLAPTSAEQTFADSYAELVANATELVDMLQKRLGATEFVKLLQEVKGSISARRDARRQKRRIEAVTMPEVAEKRKMRKREKEKVRRKEKSMVARGKRRGW